MEKPMNCYFDHSATTPIDSFVSEWIQENQSIAFGNPSSTHAMGRKSKHILETARQQLADVLGCASKEIVFTGSGTEANNLVLYNLIHQEKQHIITSSIEHPAILSTLSYLEPFGLTFTLIPVDSTGTVNPQDIKKAIQSDTGLISIMVANNEVGTIQPIDDCQQIAQNFGIPFHSDGVQALGKIPIQDSIHNCDLMSFSSHKFYGPKGVGFLVKKDSLKLNPFIIGGGQEFNLRGGTENIIGIGAMALAAKSAIQSLEKSSKHISNLERKCISGIREIDPKVVIHGNHQSHIPGLVSFAFNKVDNQTLLTQLDRAHIFASSGSACHSGISTPSKVLATMGINEDINLSTIRISFGKHNTQDEVDYFIQTLKSLILK